LRKVEDALKIVMDHVERMPSEKISITEAVGRVMAENVISPIYHPPCDNSAMDGFAVRWEDVKNAAKEKPVTLKVIDTVTAGKIPEMTLKEGECSSVMTGAPIINGADTVIRVEDTNRSRGETVEIHNAGKRGQDIRLRGENIKTGDPVFEDGTLIGAAEAGMMALIGKPVVSVYRRPVVAILVTGDEIRDLDEEYDENKITNSNGYTIASQVLEAGGIPSLLGIARDNMDELRKKLSHALKADVVLTSGGVSMGYHDFVKEVFEELGVERKFWRVGMRPGHPLAFGCKGATPVFGLPGNPVSTMVSFEQFVRPLLRAMTGHRDPYRPVVEATLTEDIYNKPGRKHFVRAVLDYANGSYSVRSTGAQGSGLLLSMSRSNSLIVLPEEGGDFKTGTVVKVQLLGRQDKGRQTPGF